MAVASTGAWRPVPGSLSCPTVHGGLHGAGKVSGVLKPGGTEHAIWVQVQGLQDVVADRRHLPVDQRGEGSLEQNKLQSLE